MISRKAAYYSLAFVFGCLASLSLNGSLCKIREVWNLISFWNAFFFTYSILDRLECVVAHTTKCNTRTRLHHAGLPILQACDTFINFLLRTTPFFVNQTSKHKFVKYCMLLIISHLPLHVWLQILPNVRELAVPGISRKRSHGENIAK